MSRGSMKRAGKVHDFTEAQAQRTRRQLEDELRALVSKDERTRQRTLDYLKQLEAEEAMPTKKPLTEVVPVYTLEEVAAALKMDVRTLRRHASDGLLRAKKIGRSYYVTEESFRLYVTPDPPKATGQTPKKRRG